MPRPLPFTPFVAAQGAPEAQPSLIEPAYRADVIVEADGKPKLQITNFGSPIVAFATVPLSFYGTKTPTDSHDSCIVFED